jgi:CubicO group peptidase (beta-lactamase class C family)
MNLNDARHLPRFAVLAALAAVAAAPFALARPPVVKNHRPEQTADPPRIEDPLWVHLTGRKPQSLSEMGVTAEDLLLKLRDLHSTLRHEEALLIVDQLVELVPDRPVGHYNRACVLARMRRTDESLQALHQAIDCGWRHVVHTRYDTDLDGVRHDVRFEKLMTRMSELREAEAIEPSPRRTSPWIEIVEDLDREVPGLLKRYHVPGATVALLHEHEVVWTAGFGVARVGDESPISDTAAFDLRAPIDTLAVLAALKHQTRDDEFNVANLLAYGVETSPRHGRRVAAAPRTEPAYLVRNTPRADTRDAGTPQLPGVTAPASEHFLDLLQLAIEVETAERFDRYCRQNVLRPSGVAEADFVPAGQTTRQVTGHSLLGTPLDLAPADGELRTSAGDLANLVASLHGDRPLASLADELTKVGALGDRLGLRLLTLDTRDGVRMEIAGSHAGQGCLVRWYPEHGSGVVILFNAEDGGEAAERIAHLALGGAPGTRR